MSNSPSTVTQLADKRWAIITPSGCILSVWRARWAAEARIEESGYIFADSPAPTLAQRLRWFVAEFFMVSPF